MVYLQNGQPVRLEPGIAVAKSEPANREDSDAQATYTVLNRAGEVVARFKASEIMGYHVVQP